MAGLDPWKGRWPNSQGGLGKSTRTEIREASSGREEEGSAAEGDRLEGSTEVGGRRPPGVSQGGDHPGGGQGGGGAQGGPGSGRRCRRSGLGKNTCSVQSGGMYMRPKNVSYPLT